MTYLITAVGLGIGNYLFQLLNGGDWSFALKTTFFQCVAIVALAFFQKLMGKS